MTGFLVTQTRSLYFMSGICVKATVDNVGLTRRSRRSNGTTPCPGIDRVLAAGTALASP